MQKRGNSAILLLAMIICAVCACSCANSAAIVGKWANSDRTILFDGQRFEVRFMNSQKVLGFRGSYALQGKSLTLKYEEYLDSAGKWTGLEGTDFQGYQEKITLKATKTRLDTFIPASGKSYSYIRD